MVSASALGLSLTFAALWMAKHDLDHRNEKAVAGRLAAEGLGRANTYHTLIERVQSGRSELRIGWSWQGLTDLASAAAIDTPLRDLDEIRNEAAQCLAATDARLVAEFMG